MRTRSIACALPLSLALAVAVLAGGCGNKVQSCVDSECAAGNKCIALAGDVRCRKTCSSNTDANTSCPFGYNCEDPASTGTAFCVQSEARRTDGQPLQSKPTGQWGSPCVATKGLHNPDCDVDQGFLCYAQLPTDAQAYCTRYDCTKDDECGPGFWCSTINRTPNADTPKRGGIGDVQSVCLRRTFCATCGADVDCPDVAGTHQHCIHDNGISFCAPECTGAGTCPTEAKCILANLGSTMICYPRSKACVGDGSICSPCRADSDCGDDGVCIKGDYTTEKSCAKKASSCSACPTSIKTPPVSVGCLKEATDTQPANYCFGLYSIAGEPSDIGCYSPSR
jgi:hypothetical protein